MQDNYVGTQNYQRHLEMPIALQSAAGIGSWLACMLAKLVAYC